MFYTAASLSGAFGGTYGFRLKSAHANKSGLLARGLAEIGPRGGIEGWRWILIIEGLLVREGNIKTKNSSDCYSDICVWSVQLLRPSK